MLEMVLITQINEANKTYILVQMFKQMLFMDLY